MLTRTTVTLVCTAALLTGCGERAEVLQSAQGGGANAPASPSSTRVPATGLEPLVIAVAKEGKNAYAYIVEEGREVHVELETCEGCGSQWKVDEAGDPSVAVVTAERATSAGATGGRTTQVVLQAVGAGTTNVVLGYPGASGASERSVVVSLTVT